MSGKCLAVFAFSSGILFVSILHLCRCSELLAVGFCGLTAFTLFFPFLLIGGDPVPAPWWSCHPIHVSPNKSSFSLFMTSHI